MAALVVPSGYAPSNLVLPPELRDVKVDGDLYDICGRVKEIDPSLRIAPLIDDPQGYRMAVTEVCRDGVERLVFKVRELDARVLNHLRMLMSLSLQDRMKKIEEDERRFEAEEHENQLDELYERVGRPMWTDLEKCGFIDRPTSYPKKGIKPTRE